VDPAGIELEMVDLEADDNNEIIEEDENGCDLNMESHRNYNTPEELKKRDGSQMVIPNSLINAGNPTEKNIGVTAS